MSKLSIQELQDAFKRGDALRDTLSNRGEIAMAGDVFVMREVIRHLVQEREQLRKDLDEIVQKHASPKGGE